QTDRGFVKTNEWMQTGEPGIYAIGDIVLGTPQLAHVGAMEGIVAVSKIAGKEDRPINPLRIPNVTFCHPEIGSVGLTEAKARERGYDIKVGKFPFTANSRASIVAAHEGFIKIISDAKYGEILGVHIIGPQDYITGLRLQEKLVALRKEGHVGDVLLLLEHPPVITLGRNAKTRNIVASTELLAQRGVEVHECDRGGDVTFHGPGQLVAYPIFDLRGFPSTSPNRSTLGAIEYVRRLEEVLIRTCADFSIPATRIPGLTGVWTNASAG